MIRYSLACDKEHAFEGWFASSEDFDRQKDRGLVSCPICDSRLVSKTLMAPNVSTARKSEAIQAVAMDAARREMLEKVKEVVKQVRATAEDVGEKFPEEARKIHYGEAEERGIIGKASIEEVQALTEEGIEIAPLPSFPEDAN